MEIYKLNISPKAKLFLYTLQEVKVLEKTYDQLSDFLSISRSLLPAIIKELEENELIVIERAGGRKANTYKLNF